MKRFAIAAAAALLLSTAAYAEEMKFPSDAPVASIDVPEGWTAKEYDGGVEISSPDESVYLAIDVSEAKDADAVVKDAIDFLAGQGVTVDPATAKQTDGQLNGMPASNVDWDGTDKDGPVSISLAAVQPSPENMLVVTYWGTKGEQDKNAEALQGMIGTLKAVSE